MFNIGSVARMTNILEATLRVWERRYGFPKAVRSSGGHRLYSQEDVYRLQWVKTRIDEGMPVSNAIRALQSAEDEGRFAPLQDGGALGSWRHDANTSLEFYQRQLYEALVGHQLDQVGLILGQAQALYPLEEIILQMIVPVLQRIGESWEAGETDVATEHLATNYLRYMLLVWMQVGPPPFAVNPVILACGPEELHEGGLLMLGVLLRRLRWPVRYLGQAVPLSNLSRFIQDLAPQAIVFVASSVESARALAEWPILLPSVAKNDSPQVCFGGQAFVDHPDLIQKVKGRYLGDTLQEGVQRLNAMLQEMNPFAAAGLSARDPS
jgi:DNA-binding transcriptional MerR regulator